MSQQHIHFVTGRLAEQSLRRVVASIAESAGFDYSVDVLPISVAALMTPVWIEQRWQVPTAATSVLIPGHCRGDLDQLSKSIGCLVQHGPTELHQLPAYFLNEGPDDGYGDWDIEIVAEINHCPRLKLDEIVHQARDLADDGADVIDLGCDPDGCWTGLAEAVRALRETGLRVSVDSLDPSEIERAVGAGAELVFSVNSSNREAAKDWGVEVVAIPDEPATLAGLDATINALSAANVPFRIDPIIEPIGCGFAESLGRYLEIRRRYPEEEMLMGIGNLTELTDVDSAGVNVLLLGFCQELAIRSVLTTQVINWARSSVRECDLARRLVHYARQFDVPPKNIDDRLVMLRDARLVSMPISEIASLAQQLRDRNIRIFVADQMLHMVTRQTHVSGVDAFEVFQELIASDARAQHDRGLDIDAGHAFYLGYEMAKATTALHLGKQYRQDEPLDWGFATQAENHARLRRMGSRTAPNDESSDNLDS